MKTDIWPDDTSMLQMNDWLAELRDDGDAQLLAGRHACPASAAAPRPGPALPRPGPAAACVPYRPAAPVEAFAAKARARAEANARAQAMARAAAMTCTEARARAPSTVRAVIGDALRMPIMWCEMGSCVSWHSDPAALGEADIRARALAAGWRLDALGRLACPRCQQTDAGFCGTGPVVPWDRHTAVIRVARMTAAGRDGSSGAARAGGAGLPPAAAPGLVPLPGQPWQRELVSRAGHGS